MHGARTDSRCLDSFGRLLSLEGQIVTTDFSFYFVVREIMDSNGVLNVDQRGCLHGLCCVRFL